MEEDFIQTEMPLPTLNRPKWHLRGYFGNKEIEYGIFDTESEAITAKGIFSRYSPGLIFKIIEVE